MIAEGEDNAVESPFNDCSEEYHNTPSMRVESEKETKLDHHSQTINMKNLIDEDTMLKSKAHTPAYEFNQLMKETIVEIHLYLNDHSDEEELQMMKKQGKKIEDFDLKNVHYHQTLSYHLLGKLTYIEDKFKDRKAFPLTKLIKQKNILIDKVKTGLRNYDNLTAQYQPKKEKSS